MSLLWVKWKVEKSSPFLALVFWGVYLSRNSLFQIFNSVPVAGEFTLLQGSPLFSKLNLPDGKGSWRAAGAEAGSRMAEC